VQFAKAVGLRVVGVDARDEGLALSKEMGADVVVDAREGKQKVVERVKEATGGVGVDATINVSDHETAAATACAITKLHGRVVQIALPAQVSIPATELAFRDIKLGGSLIASQEETKQMLDVVAEHNIRVRTNTFHGLNEIPKMLEFAHSGKMSGKAIVIVDKEQVEAK
jgi:alcohol dehydrogenase, propanol-preferring